MPLRDGSQEGLNTVRPPIQTVADEAICIAAGSQNATIFRTIWMDGTPGCRLDLQIVRRILEQFTIECLMWRALAKRAPH